MIGRNRQKGETFAEGAQSWRELVGSRRSRIHSSAARKRRWMRLAKLFSILALLILIPIGIFQLLKTPNQDTKKAVTAATVDQLESILFLTDGVLTDSWLEATIGPQRGQPIMKIDIFALKQKLEETTQVKSASVERIFPSDLRIEIVERKPILRLITASSDGTRHLRLIARDGFVYRGLGYSRDALTQLPYLHPYQHADGSYLPLLGIEPVVKLLDLVNNIQPELFDTWEVVSLQYFNGNTELPGQVIEVRSRNVPKIVFSASKDFALQLDRLAYILDYFRKNGEPALKRIDLSLRGAAAVQLSSGRAQVY